MVYMLRMSFTASGSCSHARIRKEAPSLLLKSKSLFHNSIHLFQEDVSSEGVCSSIADFRFRNERCKSAMDEILIISRYFNYDYEHFFFLFAIFFFDSQNDLFIIITVS